MEINKDLIIGENNFFPTTSSELFLIRLLYEELQATDKRRHLQISFNIIKKHFDIDIRQKYINRLLNEIATMKFTYKGKKYRYIDHYINEFDERIYSIFFPADTAQIWHENTISYDFNIIKDIKTNKYAIALYEYFKTGERFMPLNKFHEIFKGEGYGFYEKRRELEKAVKIINDNTDIRVSIEFSYKQNGFSVLYT